MAAMAATVRAAAAWRIEESEQRQAPMGRALVG